MIVGVDHLALSAADVERQDEALQEGGFGRAFHHPRVPNPPIKRDLLSRWVDEHDLALYRAPGSIPVEIVDHGPSEPTRARYLPVLGEVEGPVGPDREPERHEGLGAPVVDVRRGGDARATFDHLVARTSDVDESRSFWEHLGLKGTDEERLVLEPVVGDVRLHLVLGADAASDAPTPLDGAGFNCLAFVSSSIHRDRERLVAAGYRATPVGAVPFPDKTLQICFAVGPSGEPVELVSPSDQEVG